MKRIGCFILAVCMMFIFAVSCSESDGEARPLKVIFYGSSPDTYGVDISIWDRSLLEEHEDGSAPRSAEIELLGQKFTGEYQHSSVFYPAAHVSHVYKGEYVTFAVNAETGAIDLFNVSYQKTDETYSEDECREIAARAAQHFIDTDEYTLTVSDGEDRYYFLYKKYVEDIPSRDALNIGISKYTKGFCTLGSSLTGSFEVNFDTKRAIRRLKAADKESILEEKVKSMFTGDYKWSHDEYAACTLPGGVVALYTKVTVSTYLEDEADGERYTYPSTSAFDAYIFETLE